MRDDIERNKIKQTKTTAYDAHHRAKRGATNLPRSCILSQRLTCTVMKQNKVLSGCFSLFYSILFYCSCARAVNTVAS